jgi:protease-4
MAPAAAEELRLAVKSFRAAGKPVWAHSQGLYPSGVISSTYMLGAAADQLWMQSNASLQVTGIAVEEAFLKGAFDRFGIVADFEKRAEYKTAVNPYLYEGFTPEHRESTLSWMNSIYLASLNAAAADRKQAPAALRATLEAGPYSAEVARARGLIDQLGHVEQAREALLDKVGEGAEIVEFEDYNVPEDGGGERPLIAVVEAEGPIVTGTSDDAGFGAGAAIYSDDLAEALYDAAEDDDVKAVVFRLSSPGGQDTASDQVLAALNAVKKAGKPVVVSMGTYAASGGYWVASQADRIVAQPSTLTGSIGIYGGKLAIGPALARYGVDLESVTVGSDLAGAYSIGEPLDQAQRAALASLIDDGYRDFVALVAKGRNMTPARVQEIARGRVWTGEQARQIGLVDELGGYYTAVQAAKRLAKIGPDEEVRFKRLPAEKSPLEALQGLLGVSAGTARTLAAAGWVLSDPRAVKLLDGLAEARLRDPADGRGATVLAPTPF